MQVPAPFEYERATSVENALALLERHGPEARLIAGGHSLLPMMKLRLARPETLIDINDLSDYRIFADAEGVIADPIVRNRGTIGGSLCQADPSEDLSAVLSALRGSVIVRSAQGSETIAVRDFHLGPYETRVQGAQMLVEVRVPIRPGAGSSYQKVERRVGDW
nr:FAD binding domain-containing protein [Actinomycetota bacterium]